MVVVVVVAEALLVIPPASSMAFSIGILDSTFDWKLCHVAWENSAGS